MSGGYLEGVAVPLGQKTVITATGRVEANFCSRSVQGKELILQKA